MHASHQWHMSIAVSDYTHTDACMAYTSVQMPSTHVKRQNVRSPFDPSCGTVLYMFYMMLLFFWFNNHHSSVCIHIFVVREATNE